MGRGGPVSPPFFGSPSLLPSSLRMPRILGLLRGEPRARRFFAAYAQSSLGNGAGYVALVVLAYDRWHSPWAITLVLMADFVPAMVFGPVFGAAADRWSRRGAAVVADLLRAGAFIALGLVGGIWATVALALVVGVGAGMFTPALLAGLPSLVDEERLPAATSLYGAITDAGRTVGPALAALVLTIASADTVVIANGVTFLISAAVLATVSFGAVSRSEREGGPGVLAQAREGVAAVARMRGIRTLVLASSGMILFGSMLNVAELLLAKALHSGSVGYSMLVAAAGGGFVLGSLSGARSARLAQLKRRYLLGILLISLGLVAAVIPSYALAAAGLALTGYGNGLMLVNERLLCQRVVPQHLLARAFAVFDTAGSWGFAIAFLGAAAVLSLAGTRTVLLIAGIGALAIWALASAALRATWSDEATPSEDGVAVVPAVEPVPGT